MVQKRRPNMALFLEWCAVCKNTSENVDHLFLHCTVAYFLWSNLYKTFNLSWSAPVSCYSLLLESFSCLRGTKKARVLWDCAVLAIFWVVWNERNQRIFDNKAGKDSSHLWDEVKFWASLWSFITAEFKDISFFFILLNWEASVS